jgi:putative transposase
MLNQISTLQHTAWECKYHVVFIPKYRRKTLFGSIRSELGPLFKELARQRGATIEEGHIMVDHVHMLISIPPKYAVSTVIGYLKGKSAIYIARKYRGKRKNFSGENFWARGYFITTVGRDETLIREYIRNQETADKHADQIPLFR